MRALELSRAVSIALALAITSIEAPCAAQAAAPHLLLEVYPAPVEASKQIFHNQVSAAGVGVNNVPFYLIVPTVQRWRPGQTVTIAFKGGDPALYAKIAGAASDWLTKGGANLIFSFTDASGKYRTWTLR